MTTGKRLLSKVAPYAALLSAVGNPHRLAIVFLLREKHMTPAEMSGAVGLAQPLVLHHLNILLKTGWVSKSRHGFHVVYVLKKQPFRDLFHAAGKDWQNGHAW